MAPTLLTTAEAAQRLGLSPSRIRHLVLEGRLKGTRYGRDILFTPADLDRFAALQRPNGRPRTTPEN
jgi:excisionase family DNA binding protein